MMRRSFLAAGMSATAAPRTPVLVELFTSEGCSSCPPADAFLARLHQEQPVSGADAIVLSEHVDYWNYIGWRDPFSSAAFSARQQEYGRRFRLNSVYTPQLVIDGAAEMVGSDTRRALHAIEAAARSPKPEIRLHAASGMWHVEADAGVAGEIWLAAADASAESSVTRGENAGRRLPHVMVVRSLERIGSSDGKRPFTWQGKAKSAGRVVAFAQEPGAGRVAAVTRLP